MGQNQKLILSKHQLSKVAHRNNCYQSTYKTPHEHFNGILLIINK